MEDFVFVLRDFIEETPIIFFLIIIVLIGASIGAFISRKEKNDKIITSKGLLDEVNRENQRKGNAEIPQVNPAAGISTNSIALKDKSWDSVPDFFAKLFKKH